MGKRDIAELILKLYAMFYGVTYLSMTIPAFVIFVFYRSDNYMVESLLTPITWLVLSVLVWIFAKPLANFLFRSSGNTEPIKISLSVKQIEQAALTIIGVLVLIGAIPHIANMGSQKLMSDRLGVEIEIKAQLVSSFIKAILGVWLLLGSSGIVNFVHKLRGAGK